MKLINMLAKAKNRAGFTMIELLIVIAILGILAVAVLSAINPVEQINRGRDTGTRSDAEQLINAIDRYNAFKGYYPWMTGVDDDDHLGLHNVSDEPVKVGGEDETADKDANGCHFLDKLAQTSEFNSPDSCDNAGELKNSYVKRIINSKSSRQLYIYNKGTAGASTYVCFIPQSDGFKAEAKTRCVDVNGSGLPSDIGDSAKKFLCAGFSDDNADVYTCLP